MFACGLYLDAEPLFSLDLLINLFSFLSPIGHPSLYDCDYALLAYRMFEIVAIMALSFYFFALDAPVWVRLPLASLAAGVGWTRCGWIQVRVACLDLICECAVLLVASLDAVSESALPLRVVNMLSIYLLYLHFVRRSFHTSAHTHAHTHSLTHTLTHTRTHSLTHAHTHHTHIHIIFLNCFSLA